MTLRHSTLMSRADAKARFRQREELLDFLLEVAGLAAETLDLDQLLADVARLLKRSVSAEILAILLYSERRRTLRIRYATGHREEVVRNLEIQLGEGITGAAAASRKPVRVDDVRSDPRYLNSLDPVRSELAVPMMARGRLVGVIDLESTDGAAFSAEDEALLTLIASRIGFAIDNARLHRRLERNNRTLRTLTSLSQEFSSILDLDQLLARIAMAVRVLMDFDAFSILMVEGDHLRHRFSQRYDQRVEVNNIPLGQGVTGHVASLREPILVRDTQIDHRYIPAHPDIRSEVAVPLIIKDRVIGVIDVESARLGYFTEDHQRTLQVLAIPIATAIENARLYEEVETQRREMEADLQAARRLQRVIMPRRAPAISGLELALYARPAREVSGDIYDFFEHGNDFALVAFGDSSGKGAAAALYGALVSGMLRSMGPRRRGPAVLLRALNEALIERKVSAQYVTLLGLLWKPADRTMTIANAGGLPPLIVRPTGITQPDVAGVPIGLLEEREYEETVITLERDDVVVLVSDGVQDQRDLAGDSFGDSLLQKRLMSLASHPPQEIAEEVIRSLDDFRQTVPIEDDQTILVMKVL
jgi:sigma-B regulation protein RsbU (phosphoserine phosphatase)